MNLSELWVSIRNAKLSNSIDIENFREPGQINSRLASWEPRELSLRWYRSFLNLSLDLLSERQKTLLSNLENISVGNPVSVMRKIGGGANQKFNLDYILSAVEMDFLEQALNEDLFTIRSVIEVGAGFGRTAHIVLINMPEIKNYTILDFPEMLNLSRSYLKRVLPQSLFKKISFINPQEIEDSEFDLAIQVDGLQEMDPDVIDYYFELVFDKSHYVFFRNPVGKYLPVHAGILNSENSQIPWSLGRSQKVIDIWNMSEVENLSAEHDLSYKPKNSNLKLAKNCGLFPHYRMQFFKNRLWK
jgi:putative sugar O-methyltransferase